MKLKEKSGMSPEAYENAAHCLKIIAHPVRLRLIDLMRNGDFTVGELADACEIPSHMTSEHLRLLQHCQLLSRRREGRKVYYSVAEPCLNEIMKCIQKKFSSIS